MDAVITYVNGSDKLWVAEYNKYAKKQIEEARYRDWGTLPYLIKGIRKFMPFIDKIFLVVSGVSQVPENIDLTDVRLVYHNMIMPEKYLPCFNSCTIEMFLHNIPDLDEEFIYFNDDMFPIKPVEETDFFVDSKPVLNPHLITMSPLDNFGVFQENCVNSTKLIRDKFVPTYPSNIYITQEHIMRPMLKSTYKKVWDKCASEIQKSLTRTRHNRNYNAYLFNNYDYMTGNFVQKQLNYKYIRTSNLLDSIVDEIVDGDAELICLNDTGGLNFNNRSCVIDAFKKIFEAPKHKQTIKTNKELTVVLCAIVRNENLYIREWVEWYKNLGVHKIFLYDNNEVNGEHLNDVINDYIESEYVEVINVRGKQKYQLEAYKDFYNNYSIYYDWCCFFDIDEFLTLVEDKNIKEYLKRPCFVDYNSIAINWKNYGDSNLLGNENNYDRKCLTRFTTPLQNPTGKYENNVYKKIIRGGLKKVQQIKCPHTFSPLLNDHVCNNYGRRINGKTYRCQYNYNLAYIKHFCTKTILEYLLKTYRGGGVNGLSNDYFIQNFYMYNKKTTYKDNIINLFNNTNNGTINLLVVNYNTPNLIDTLIKSIHLQVKSKYHLYIFDNSDKFDCYTSSEPNITVFDNTKGQIINFEKWLKQFPNRLNCWAKNNNWGSAKHCYSVEKCFDLINDNFILLDSDILLKKDISELYRNDLFYVGEVAQLKTQNLPRINPYICFINVKLCKEYNIHYFYAEYMHGLTPEAHNYDTGGAFYKFVNKYQHLNIKCDDYITHFGQGSWSAVANKTQLKKNITVNDWLEEYKDLWKKDIDLKDQLISFSKQHFPTLNLNLDNPITIQDKINWLKVYDSTELKTKCADKILLHEYCKEKLGKDFCIPIIKVYNKTNEINFNELPDKFVIKCNHGSGMNIIVKDKSTLNKIEVFNKLNKWLNKDFSTFWGYESHYKNINRKIFIEEYKENNGDDLVDYKISCFNGEPKIVQVIKDRFKSELKLNYYDINFNPLYYSRKDHPANYEILDEKPKTFDLMLIYAKLLSKDFKYVRVDFYEIDNEIYLGELTFTPASGFFIYENQEDSIKIGNLLSLE